MGRKWCYRPINGVTHQSLTQCTTVVQLSLLFYKRGHTDIVIDTSALIAVIVGEPEREKNIEITRGNTLIGPGSIPWKIGNSFSAMFKRHRLSIDEAQKGLKIFDGIPLRYIEPDFVKVLQISKQTNIYAYDAYFQDCAIRT